MVSILVVKQELTSNWLMDHVVLPPPFEVSVHGKCTARDFGPFVLLRLNLLALIVTSPGLYNVINGFELSTKK